MAGGIKRLTDAAIRACLARVERAPKKLFDGDGLFITTTPAGTAVWRMRYRYGGSDRILALGTHTDLGLKEARRECEKARALLREGRDPTTAKRVARADAVASTGTTFGSCGAEWLEQRRPGWSSAHFKTVSETLARHILPHIGPLPITEVTQPMIAHVVERLGDRIDTAQKVRQICAGVFRLAMARGKLPGGANPADAAREVIGRRKLKGRRPAFLTFPELGSVLRRARAAHLSPEVQLAHRLCAFTATRLGNVVAAEWPEFDLGEDPKWVIPRGKMKMQDRHFDHTVFLGDAIAAELRTWRHLCNAPVSGYLFASTHEKGHITHEAVEKVYRVTLELKGKHVPHGWRSALSTLARDAGFERDVVELALDHVHDEKVARAYDRGERRSERVRLAAWWNDQLVAAEAAR
jgi:integrase